MVFLDFLTTGISDVGLCWLIQFAALRHTDDPGYQNRECASIVAKLHEDDEETA